MKFNFKKIASALSSTLMVGSTVALAAAASYPAPFVSSGNADVAIVTGQYATLDAAAASILASDLNQVFIAQGGSEGSTTTTTGEMYPLFTSSTELYMNDSIAKQSGIITNSELPIVLADGSFSGDVDADYTQTINLNGFSRISFGKEPDTSSDPTVYLDMGTSASTGLYNATIVFDRAIAFNSTDSKGETLDLFGKEWTIGSDTDATDLVLYKSSERISLSLGGSSPTPSQQVTVDGETYTVELVSGSDTDATIRVTDSTGATQQRSVDEDQSRKINGVEVALTNVDESEALGSIIAEVTVGSQKVIFQDGSQVLVGTDEDPIENTRVDFVGGSVGALTQIRIQVFAEDSDTDAILVGDSLLDPVFGSFKLDFAELNIPVDSETDREMMEFTYSGDDQLNMKMSDKHGDEKEFAWIDNSSAMRLAYGDGAREAIQVVEGALLNKTNYVTVGNEDEGALLKVRTITNSTGGNGYSNDDVVFENVFSGDTYSTTITSDGAGTVNIKGKTYGVTYVNGPESDDEYVRLNYPDSSSGQIVAYPTIESEKGAKVGLYKPVTLDVGNIDGAGTDLSAVLLPDGDGYTTTAVTLGANGGFTIGGTVVNSTAAFNSKSITVGNLVYNFTYASAVNTTTIYLVDPRGGNIATPGVVVFEEEEDTSNNNYALVVIPEGAGTDTNGDGISTVVATDALMSGSTQTGASYADLEDSDLSQLMTLYGTVVTLDDSESDQKTATISYPDDQVQAKIYLAEGEASTTTSTGAIGTITFTDDQTSSYSGKNVIVVGGTCVNMAARKLLGVEEATPLCGSAFTSNAGSMGVGAGKYLIKSYTSPWSSSKIAVLVAGYEADDTKNGATALRDKKLDVTVGKAYTGTSATEVTAA